MGSTTNQQTTRQVQNWFLLADPILLGVLKRFVCSDKEIFYYLLIESYYSQAFQRHLKGDTDTLHFVNLAENLNINLLPLGPPVILSPFDHVNSLLSLSALSLILTLQLPV